MPYAEIDDLTMYYEEHGRADGPPLILVHGYIATAHFWEEQLPAFGERYRLIVPELRGHGRTNNPGGLAAMNHHQFARDIIGLCGELEIEQAIFCGESSGAMLQLWMAVDAPGLAAAYVWAGTTYYYSDELRAWWSRQTPESIMQDEDPRAKARHTALGPDHWREVAAAFISTGTHAHSEDFPEPADLRGITTPVLLVHGDRDYFFDVSVPAELYKLLPDAELCILPNTNHYPPSDSSEWFNPIVLDFLERRMG